MKMLDEHERFALRHLADVAAGAPRIINDVDWVDAAATRLEGCGRATSSIVAHAEHGTVRMTDITSDGFKALRVDNIIRGLA